MSRDRIFQETVAQASGWSTDEVRAELQDMRETLVYVQNEYAEIVRRMEEQVARFVEAHGENESHWPGSAWHTARSLRDRVDATDARLCSIPPVIDGYVHVLKQRGAM